MLHQLTEAGVQLEDSTRGLTLQVAWLVFMSSYAFPLVDLLSAVGGFLPSKGEARRAFKENSIAVNKAKVAEDRVVSTADLLGGQFILLQRGKKNYFLVKVG
jgi:tyrosyl-tRNA synthetase